ncbi:MAG: TetR/AcrR family transcriptional regulator [Ruminiclostridium sp.]|nr:TetR/AcrR family transcriptional regulator [Ruminiclostridium sp.]
MAKKNPRNTRGKIVSAAWQLFYEQGYEETTVEEIIETSQTSKGSFYHYFDGKDALLSTLSDLFDEKYEALQETMDPDMPAMDQLLYLNSELFRMIENKVSVELLARLLSTQLVTNGERHLLNQKRTYYRLLRKIITQGQERGEFSDRQSVSEMVRLYALSERALMYDWCLRGGEFSLRQYAAQVMPVFLDGFRAEFSTENRTEKKD